MNDMTYDVLHDAATVYERLLVPGIFDAWTHRVVDAGAVAPGHRVLDVACGTGVLARRAHAKVGAEGHVVGVDPNEGMLAVARATAPDVEWRAGRAEALPFDDERFDVVVSQFGLMFFEDRTKAIREMHRVLVPGGRMVVAVFDSLEHNAPYAAMVDVLGQTVGDAAAAALASPFVLGDTAALHELFTAAGATPAGIDTETCTERFASVREMVIADVEGWFPLAGIHLDPPVLEKLVAGAHDALARYVTDDGRVEFEASAHIVTVDKH